MKLALMPLTFLRKLPSFFLSISLLLLSSPLIPIHANSQTPAPAPVKPAPVSPKEAPYDPTKEALIVEKYTLKIHYEADGTGSRETYARAQVRADAGVKELAVLLFTYTASSQTTSIDFVRVIKPDGKVIETPAYNTQDLPAEVTRAAPMYTDIHQVHVTVKGLGVGDTIEYKVTQRVVKPDVPGQFWLDENFEKQLIYLDEVIDLDLPASIHVNVASATVQPTVTTLNGRTLYHYATKNLTHPDPDTPAKPRKERVPDIQISTFQTWQQVGAWYKSLADSQAKITPAIQARTEADIKGLTNDDDKIRAIFNDVALHIHYIGISFGIGRYQPHEADEVLSNEYGDCKDKHTLLAAMLKAAGYQAWPVLISSNAQLDEKNPSPAQFDHVITLLSLNGKLLWMDSTAEVSPVGVLFANLRDKQALAIPAEMPAYIVNTPVDLPFSALAHYNIQATLDIDGTLTGTIHQSFLGESEEILRAAYRSVAQANWQLLAQRVSYASGFAGDVSDVKISDVEQIGSPIEISYKYTRKKFGEWDQLRIMPALPPVGWAKSPGSKEIKPLEDIQIGSPGVQDYISVIQLPKEWSASIPPNHHFVADWAEYHSTYTITDGKFTAERKLLFKKSKIPLAEWDKYLSICHEIYDDETNMTSLIKPNGENASKGDLQTPPLIVSKFYEKMRPMYDLVRGIQRAEQILDNDPAVNSPELKDAIEITTTGTASIDQTMAQLKPDDSESIYWSPAVAYSWTLRGWAEFDNYNLDTAESYLKAAWGIAQDQLSGYLLARIERARGNKAAAAHQLELASITDVPSPFGVMQFNTYATVAKIKEEYKSLTGSELKATALKNGSYNGSMRQELDKANERQRYIPQTKLTGQGYFMLRYQPGKPVDVTMISGDKEFNKLTQVIKDRPFPQLWPTGEQTILYREMNLICSPYAGCDAYLSLPTKLKINVSSSAIRFNHQ